MAEIDPVELEGLMLISEMAEVLRAVEEVSNKLPPDLALYAAVQVFEQVAERYGEYDPIAQQYAELACDTVVRLRKITREMDDTMIAQAESFLRER